MSVYEQQRIYPHPDLALTLNFNFSQILQVEVNRNGTSVEALNEMFNSQKKKQKESKLKQLNKLWVEVLERSDNRKEELKSVFIMIAKDFERWELGMIKRLDAGELVTSDILVFEEKLQVGYVWYFVTQMNYWAKLLKKLWHYVGLGTTR